MKRFSKKRQSIIDCLKTTKTHPTAEWIYNQLKSEYPDLSLGTVYRNLSELKKEGIIDSVGVVGDKERFDGRTDVHIHGICKSCGKVIDIDNINIPSGLIEDAEKLAHMEIQNSKLQFEGLCSECQKNK